MADFLSIRPTEFKATSAESKAKHPKSVQKTRGPRRRAERAWKDEPP